MEIIVLLEHINCMKVDGRQETTPDLSVALPLLILVFSFSSSCGFPGARMRHYNWSEKAIRRKMTGTGRMAYLKVVRRKFRNGFREGTVAVSQKKKD